MRRYLIAQSKEVIFIFSEKPAMPTPRWRPILKAKLGVMLWLSCNICVGVPSAVRDREHKSIDRKSSTRIRGLLIPVPPQSIGAESRAPRRPRLTVRCWPSPLAAPCGALSGRLALCCHPTRSA